MLVIYENIFFKPHFDYITLFLLKDRSSQGIILIVIWENMFLTFRVNLKQNTLRKLFKEIET